MELDDELARSFALAAWECYDLRGIEVKKERALRAIVSEYQDNFADLDDDVVKEGRWKHCGISGTQPEDFAEQIVEVGDGRKVICGIRHLSMNLEKPFVQVCPNFVWRDTAEAREVYDAYLRERFSMFGPRWVQIFSKTGVESEAGGSLVVAARSGDMMQVERREEAPSVQLVSSETDDYFDWYSNSYDEFYESFPEKRDWIQKNDIELMRACREDGLLKIAKVDGERVGIIAAERSPFLGYDGVYFVEILVVPEWRRKGVAREMQRTFVAECCRDAAFVWGLIDRGNESSLRTAKANGRKVVRGECFLEV